MKIPHGTPWTTPVDINLNAPSAETTPDADDLGNGAAEPEVFVEPGEEAPEEQLRDSEETSRKKTKKKSKKPSVHTEATDFSGDRTLANECLFLQDMG
jgi:hypothetical protein